MTFGQKLRSFRRGKRMSMQECADRAGVSQPGWCYWEKPGYDNPEFKSVQKIAIGLGEPVEVVLGWTRFVSTLPEPDEEIVEIVRHLQSNLHQLPPKKRRQVLDNIKEVVGMMVKAAA